MPFFAGLVVAVMLFGGGIGTGVAVSDESPVTAVKDTTKWLVIGIGLIVFALWKGAIKWKS